MVTEISRKKSVVGRVKVFGKQEKVERFLQRSKNKEKGQKNYFKSLLHLSLNLTEVIKQTEGKK